MLTFLIVSNSWYWPFSFLYTPAPRLIFDGELSLSAMAFNSNIGSTGPRGTHEKVFDFVAIPWIDIVFSNVDLLIAVDMSLSLDCFERPLTLVNASIFHIRLETHDQKPRFAYCPENECGDIFR